jgi:putative ABC transport system permease protein
MAMLGLRHLLSRLRGLWRSDRIHDEIDEELRFHIDLRTEENIRRGMSADEARRDAERRFGSLLRAKERGYDVRGGGWLEGLWQDLRYGARMLRKQPGFTFVAVLTLALGIGANTAIFSMVNAVLLRPLPYHDPARITMLWSDNPAIQLGLRELPPTNADIVDWREQNQVFERIAAYRSSFANLSAEGEAERVGGAAVTFDFFPLLGIDPILGRTFTAEEDQPDKNRVVVISHGLWRRGFGGDPNILGKTVTLDSVDFTVIGVMPPGFNFPRGAEMPPGYGFGPQADIWIPLAMSAERWQRRNQRQLVAIGRLKPGVSLAQAQAEMSSIAQRQAQDHPDTNAGWLVRLVSLKDQVVGKTRPLLLVLLGAVAFVLLIACADVANLLLARAAARQKEIAIRAALGAGRRRVIRQLLTESVLLSSLGGALGLLVAYWGVEVLIAASPTNIPRLRDTTLDLWVLGFTAGISLLTGILFGLAPAVQATRTNLSEALKDGGRGSATAVQRRLHSLLIVSEVALALVLLVGAGLLIRSFSRLMAVDPGFNPQSVLAMDVMLPGAKYRTQESRRNFYQQVLARVETLPGVSAAGGISDVPLSGAEGLYGLAIEGQPPVSRGQEPNTDGRYVTTNYFRAMGVPLLEGRAFTESDVAGRPEVAIINETIARQLFPGEDPIGKRIKLGRADDSNESWLTVVGVVGDVKSAALESAPRPQVYRPFMQFSWTNLSLVIRTESDPLQLASAVRSEVKAIDPNQPVANVRTMEQAVTESVARRRFIMLLLSLFAAMALVLTVVGLYGVISYSVTQRTHEFGVRMALGAQARDVLRLVVRDGLRLTALGVGIGLAAAFALTRGMASLLFNVSASDPLTFALVTALLVVVAIVSSCIPARRATKVDPIIALRYE